MERNVDGERWVTRGWTRVLTILYETDVVIELDHVRMPEDHPDGEYKIVETLSPNSELLTETGLTENQAIAELNHLLSEGLVHHLQPFDDNDFVVYRLTDSGFTVAHDLQQTEREAHWRAENQQINVMLTVATGFLAVTATVQAITAYLQAQPLDDVWLVGGSGFVLLLLVLLTVGRRGSRGPDLWG